jgi:hypothetical protein
MKKMKKSKYILLLLIAIYGLSINAQIANDLYIYPIKPGDSLWKNLRTHAEMVEACQIPAEILSELSTDGLIESYMNYPIIMEMLAFNNFQDGFDQVLKGFNGLKELIKRQDASYKLLDRYKKMIPGNIDKNSEISQKGKDVFDFIYIEMLLAQKNIIDNLSKDNKMELLIESKSKFNDKNKDQELYGILSLTTSGYLMARLLENIDDVSFKQQISQNENLRIFVRNSVLKRTEILVEVMKAAESCLD